MCDFAIKLLHKEDLCNRVGVGNPELQHSPMQNREKGFDSHFIIS
jgi:hypothetical protein